MGLGVSGAPLADAHWTRVDKTLLTVGNAGPAQGGTSTTSLSNFFGGNWPCTISWEDLGWTVSAMSDCGQQQTMAATT
jgi:hypothetical protein